MRLRNTRRAFRRTHDAPDGLGALHRRSTSFFRTSPDIEQLAREQDVRLDATFDDLKGDFWPEDESVDEFIETARRQRREGLNR